MRRPAPAAAAALGCAGMRCWAMLAVLIVAFAVGRMSATWWITTSQPSGDPFLLADSGSVPQRRDREPVIPPSPSETPRPSVTPTASSKPSASPIALARRFPEAILSLGASNSGDVEAMAAWWGRHTRASYAARFPQAATSLDAAYKLALQALETGLEEKEKFHFNYFEEGYIGPYDQSGLYQAGGSVRDIQSTLPMIDTSHRGFTCHHGDG